MSRRLAWAVFALLALTSAGCEPAGAPIPDGDVVADTGPLSDTEDTEDTTPDDTADPGECDPGRPPVDPADMIPCDLPECIDAHCVWNNFIPVDLLDSLADCDATSKCLPDLFILTNGNFTPPTCRSVGDTEGRCLSKCLPAVAAQMDVMPQSTCASGDACVPCYDPTTGLDTGACHLSCDTGPVEPPVSFDACCHDLGSCVPASAVPTDQQGMLGQDSCDTDEVCAPDDIGDPGFVPPTCASVAAGEGRCLPDCLPRVAALAGTIPQDTCADYHLCVPCYEPITGVSTGACETGTDTPTDPPTTFERCCGDEGACVPTTVLDPSQQDSLGVDTCSDADDRCVPDVLASVTAPPPTCVSLADAEGRCLPECMPAVAALAGTIPQDSCDPGSLCVPCYEPITGMTTGACDSGGDAPVDPPATFERCCSDEGACVPTSVLDPSQQDSLGVDTCSDADDRCVPDALASATAPPPTCTSLASAEGRCLPECMPAVAALSGTIPQDVCDPGSLCVPCYEPITGASTGACDSGGDTPVDPPTTFERCCTDAGACVPDTLIDPSQTGGLGADTCSGADELCVPDALASVTSPPPTCSSLLDAEGRCLPDCMPVVASLDGTLPQDICDPGSLCVPCYQPVTGTSTGACETNGDSPVDPPVTFETCCEDPGGIPVGTCIPDTLVPDDQEAILNQDTCVTTDDLCVPTNLALNPPEPFPSCDTGMYDIVFSSTGACIPECIADNNWAIDLIFGQQDCAVGERCVACWTLLTDDTGACLAP